MLIQYEDTVSVDGIDLKVVVRHTDAERTVIIEPCIGQGITPSRCERLRVVLRQEWHDIKQRFGRPMVSYDSVGDIHPPDPRQMLRIGSKVFAYASLCAEAMNQKRSRRHPPMPQAKKSSLV